MTAFLPTPHAPPLNVPGARVAQLCSRRQTPSRQPARVRFSATTDEAPPIDGIPVPRSPPPRPRPNAPPQRPARFSSSDDRHRSRSVHEGRGPDRPAFVPDPAATYYTRCGACQASYEIDPKVLGPRGRKVGCAVCGNHWFQRADKMLTLRETEELKEYPMEEKDRLMEKQARARKERFRGSERRGPPREGQGGRRGGSRTQSQHSLFIGNLPFTATQEELEQMIGAAVEFRRLNIVRDQTGRSRGFAFAELKSDEDVQTAVNMLNGKELGGRTISVRTGRKN